MLNGEDNADPALRPAGRASRSGSWTSRRASSCGAAASSLRANVYAMEFENEIALTGELSEIGLPVRRNAGRSHRRGVELDLAWHALAALRLAATAALSRNRIEDWTQVYDVYDAEGAWSGTERVRVHRDVRAAADARRCSSTAPSSGSPSSDARAPPRRAASWTRRSSTTPATPASARPSFFNLDLQASLSLARWVKRGEPRIRVQATNLLDDDRQLAGRLQLPLLRRATRPGGDDPRGHRLLLPARHPQRVRHARRAVLT